MYAVGEPNVESRLSLSLQLGIICSITGALAARLALIVEPGSSLIIAASAISGFAVGAYAWHTFVALKAYPSLIRVVVIMTLVAMLAPILSWLIFISVLDFCKFVKNPFALLNALPVALIFGIMTTFLVGWLTVPTAIVIGLFFRTKHLRRNPGRVEL
jgi:hypothetical protein